MATRKITSFGSSESPWLLDKTEAARQAVAPLRGYAYQLHASVAAWIRLPSEGELYLEVAEDYAQLARAPGEAGQILKATQVKDTRESGAVTLNSIDVQEAIEHLFSLQAANPGRTVSLTFLTTSPVGKEQKKPLRNKVAGLQAWQDAAAGGDISALHGALRDRFTTGSLGEFIQGCSETELRSQLVTHLDFVCGEADWQMIETASRDELVAMCGQVHATEDMAWRAYDVLLGRLLATILSSEDRKLDRQQLLVVFRQATSLTLPSQTVVDFVSSSLSNPASGDARGPTSPQTNDLVSLRRLAKVLLDVSTPPSLQSLFPDTPQPVRRAIDELSTIPRWVVELKPLEGPGQRIRGRLVDLIHAPERHHLFYASPGAGKTHALWQVAQELLAANTTERSASNINDDSSAIIQDAGTEQAIPIFLSVGGLKFSTDVLTLIGDLGLGFDPREVLRDPRICVFLDGWSEFATGEQFEERAKLLRLLHGTRVIACGRQTDATDTTFRSWSLELLAPVAVRGIVQRAFAGEPTPQNLSDLLRLPLVLSLYLLLGGSATSQGELLSHLHRHLAQRIPPCFDDVLAGAISTLSLSCDRSYLRLVAELRVRSSSQGLTEPVLLMERLGTITQRSKNALPIHDLYWSWLAGLGLLRENRTRDALLQLDTRESYSLAMQAGETVSPESVECTTPIDVVLAASFDASRGRPMIQKCLAEQLDAMFTHSLLAVRCRAAIAGLCTKRVRYVRMALAVISEIATAGLHVSELHEALNPAALFANRSVVAEWLGSPGTEMVIDVIANHGDAEWAPWIEHLFHMKRLDPVIALAAFLACSDHIPEWGFDHIHQLTGANAWKLRPTSERGANLALARWIGENYAQVIDTKSSSWLEVNRVLVSCADDDVFERLLAQFSSMDARAQELLGFAVVERGSPWIARFQQVAFASADGKHHHRLAKHLSLAIDDATARQWIALGHYESGWRILIARHGAAILPELIAELPASFEGIDSIPALAVMRFLKEAPLSLLDEIDSRLRGHTSPKVGQDVLEAVARVKPKGMFWIVRLCALQPGALSSYHLMQVIRLYTVWRKEHSLDLGIKTPQTEIPFRLWALFNLLSDNWDNHSAPAAFAFAPDLAVPIVLNSLSQDDDRAKAILENLKSLQVYDAALFDRMMGSPVLAPLIPKVFAEAFDSFPADQLERLVASDHVNQEEMFWRLSHASNPLHRKIHLFMIERVLSDSLNLHNIRYVAAMLRSYSRDELTDMLQPITHPESTPASENVYWLLREIGSARRELLVDEAGNLQF